MFFVAICFIIYYIVCAHFFKQITVLFFLSQMIFGLLIPLFFFFCNCPSDAFLFLLWSMSLFLSLYDYLYLMVAPKVFYPCAFLTLIVYFWHYSFNYSQVILPLGVFWFFLILDLFLPNSFGGGDVKLLMLYSVFLSFQQLLLLITIASLLGIIFTFFYLYPQKKKNCALPFVPFLTIALLIISIFFSQ